jgi:hypothetical protein
LLLRWSFFFECILKTTITFSMASMHFIFVIRLVHGWVF